MASKRDYYEILGVERTATTQEIKTSYRKLAIQHHPDRNPGDARAEETFKEAAEAYAVLSDVDKRAQYDRFGHAGLRGGGGGFDPSVFADFSDILGDLFGFGDRFGGSRRRRGGATSGADLRYDLGLRFEEAAFGTEVTLRIPRLEHCEACSGSGGAGGSEPATCPACRGQGQVRYSQGFFTVARTCPQCGGMGTVVTDPCPECRGEGRVERERSLAVKIPPGVDSGARLRLNGEGEHGPRGGPSGDLYVVIAVEPHATFERRGADVFSRLEIGFPQAVLGAALEVETLHGADTVEIAPGTQHGTQLVLRGRGIQRLGRSGYGDHVVEIALAVPRPSELGDEELDLLRRLAELRQQPVRERGVLGRVKDLFG
jgi:molecular chaperone DnaJ